MYKIYVNELPLYLIGTSELGIYKEKLKDKNALFSLYIGKTKQIFNFLDTLEKKTEYEIVVVYYHDVEILYSDFMSLFRVFYAAGGVVFSEDSFLTIYRRGFWDLPKGKIEEGETVKDAAVREVEEETGVNELKLGKHLLRTYHTFRSPKKGTRSLKISDWFEMNTEKRVQLQPQMEEDIELAVWMSEPEIYQKYPLMYKNIVDVFEAYFEYKRSQKC